MITMTQPTGRDVRMPHNDVQRCQFCGTPTIYKSRICRYCQEMMKKAPLSAAKAPMDRSAHTTN